MRKWLCKFAVCSARHTWVNVSRVVSEAELTGVADLDDPTEGELIDAVSAAIEAECSDTPVVAVGLVNFDEIVEDDPDEFANGFVSVDDSTEGTEVEDEEDSRAYADEPVEYLEPGDETADGKDGDA